MCAMLASVGSIACTVRSGCSLARKQLSTPQGSHLATDAMRAESSCEIIVCAESQGAGGVAVLQVGPASIMLPFLTIPRVSRRSAARSGLNRCSRPPLQGLAAFGRCASYSCSEPPARGLGRGSESLEPFVPVFARDRLPAAALCQRQEQRRSTSGARGRVTRSVGGARPTQNTAEACTSRRFTFRDRPTLRAP
eukprot:2539010-Prymnesium_polylepis.1